MVKMLLVRRMGRLSSHPQLENAVFNAVTNRTMPLHHMSLQNSLILGRSQVGNDKYRYFRGQNGFFHHNGKVIGAPTVYSQC